MREFLIRFFSLTLLVTPVAHALDLDWSGQFRAESLWISNYNLDTKNEQYDAARAAGGAYYIPGGGQGGAHQQSLFLKLRPKLIVNDNVYIKSEWWVGDPVYGMFGNAFPYRSEQRLFNSTFSRGSSISAQRLWAEFLTDLGTFQVGRMPLNWGMGLIYSSGDGIWDRYMSTGDSVRLVSRFGQFVLSPATTKFSTGNTFGGACDYSAGSCNGRSGSAGLSDYSLSLKYDNPEEGFETGVNFIKRIGGASQDPVSGVRGFEGRVVSLNTTTWDIFAKKKFGSDFTLTGELPLVSGNVGGGTYKTYAVAAEADWKISESWNVGTKLGQAPGQPNSDNGTTQRYKIFYFHPNYKPALIMFNYQLANVGRLHTQNNPNATEADLRSPYDNPVANARYIALNGAYKTGKWTFRGNWIYARALQVAENGKYFYNTWNRQHSSAASVGTQEKSLGWEADLGFTFAWDDHIQFLWDNGLYFPGAFYKFSNTTVENKTAAAFATVFRVGVSF